jgi:hypothetical protein
VALQSFSMDDDMEVAGHDATAATPKRIHRVSHSGS